MADLIYENPLASEQDVAGFIMEGDGSVSFPNGRLRLTHDRDESEGQAANIVYWCPQKLPDHIRITWDFYPVQDPGLCILFFAADGRAGKDLFDPSLTQRTGLYGQYHSGDINALHVSYYRRKGAKGRAFHTCNLRKSKGFHLVAVGPNPLPGAAEAMPPYTIAIEKAGPRVRHAINDLTIFDWQDDGETFGPLLGGGYIGFRQMAPFIGEYANLRVEAMADSR